MGTLNLGSSGTITNLAVGGLPDGTVDADTLAAGAVTTTTGTNNFTVADGDLIIGTAGHGISFAATSGPTGSNSASTNEILDDFEEGTWTPRLTFGGNSAGMTYDNQLGTYVIVGRFVYAHCVVDLTDKGYSSGSAAINDLPYVAGNSVAIDIGGLVSYTANLSSIDQTQVYGYDIRNTSRIHLYHKYNSAYSLNAGNFNDNSQIRFEIFFQTDS